MTESNQTLLYMAAVFICFGVAGDMNGVVIAGIICLLVIAGKRLFRKHGREGVSSTTGSSYTMDVSFTRIVFQIVVVVFFMGLVYAMLHSFLFYWSGLSFDAAKILFSGAVSIFMLALWNSVGPAIGYPPLRLTERGFSVFNSGEIPWQEVSEIELVRILGKHPQYALLFHLVPGSKAEPKARVFGRTLQPPRIAMSLETVCWDRQELFDQLTRFTSGRVSANSEPPFLNFGAAFTATISTMKLNNESAAPETDSGTRIIKKPKKKSNYMGNGFHIRKH